MERRHWARLELIDAEGGIFDFAHCPHGKEWFVGKLQEFARMGGMLDVFFARTEAGHEDPDDASTWGPQNKDEIDWAGFPVAEDGTLCRMVHVSDAGTYEFAGDIEDWDEVATAAGGEVQYVSGLLGWAPYTAHYAVGSGEEIAHYFAAEPVYNLTRLAEAVGWTVQRLSTYRGRKGRDGQPLVPKATFEEGSSSLWTQHDAEEFISRYRNQPWSAGIREAQLTIRERIVYGEYLQGRAPDPRSLRAVEVARRYIQGQATRDELAAASVASDKAHRERYTDALQATLGRPSGLIGTPGYVPYNAAVTHAAWAALQAVRDVDERRSVTGVISKAIDEAVKGAYLAAVGDGFAKDDAGRIGEEARAALRAEFEE